MAKDTKDIIANLCESVIYWGKKHIPIGRFEFMESICMSFEEGLQILKKQVNALNNKDKEAINDMLSCTHKMANICKRKGNKTKKERINSLNKNLIEFSNIYKAFGSIKNRVK